MLISNIANISRIVFLIVLGVACLLFAYRIIYALMAFGKEVQFKDAKENHRFAVLIPARNESQVIRDLLEALKNQDYDANKIDTYIVVKDPEDPTIKIGEEYGAYVLVHPDQKCKGDALDFAIKNIYEKQEKYDAFAIFDADNIPKQDFIKEINKALDAGYDIGMGYRNSKNWNDNWVSAGSSMTFTFVNTLSNKGRSKLGVNNIFSGTGYFIKESVIEPYKSWPFKTLTEDYEISLYAIVKNLKTTYVERAEYFDEQPTSIKTSCKQRKRWIKGYFTVRKNYVGKIIKGLFKDKQNKWSKVDQTFGLLPVVMIVASTIIYLALQIAFTTWAAIEGLSVLPFILEFIYTLGFVYFGLMIVSIIGMVAERKRVKFSAKTVANVMFLNPIFTISWIPIAVAALFSKNLGWATIEHTKSISKKQNSKTEK